MANTTRLRDAPEWVSEVRVAAGVASMVGGLLLSAVCMLAARRIRRNRFEESVRSQKVLAILDILRALSVMDAAFGLSNGVLEAISTFVTGTCNTVFVVGLPCFFAGSGSSLFSIFFVWTLRRALLFPHAPPPSWRLRHALEVATWAACLLLGLAFYIADRHTYNCEAWLEEDSKGVFGSVGYLCYAAVTATATIYSLVIYLQILQHTCRVRQAFVEASLAASRASLVESERLSALRLWLCLVPLDLRLGSYILAFVVVHVPALADVVVLLLDGYQPTSLFVLRWTLQPLQGALNALVFLHHGCSRLPALCEHCRQSWPRSSTARTSAVRDPSDG